MIDCFTIETAHLFGDALAQQFRLRHKLFVEKNRWGVPAWKGMEYDQYDTPAALYLVWRDTGGAVRGVARMAPTEVPYMIKDLWPNMVEGGAPVSPLIWESTRLGVDHDLPKELRRQVLAELVQGYLEASLAYGLTGLIGVGYSWCWEHSFTRMGWAPQRLGPICPIDGEPAYVAMLPVSPERLAQVRAVTGKHYGLIRTASDFDYGIAAE